MSIISIIIAYLLGSVSTAIVVSKLFNLEDPRITGSGNPGATNMLRLGGKGLAGFVLAGDLLKGVLAILIGKLFGLSSFALGFVALAAVAGHILPVFASFQGGKGVATAIGCCFGLNLILGIFVAVIWFAVIAYSRYSSLAGIVAVGASPIVAIYFSASYFIPLGFMAAVVVIKHHENIARLMAGTESKVEI